MRGFILNATSIKVNWTTSSETNGYVIEYTTGGVSRNVVSTSEDEIVLTDLSPMSTYTISVYSYIDLPSVNSTIISINNISLLVPATAPSSLTEVNKTATTITVSWTALDSSDADGYVVNVTSDTDTVQTVQVEGSSNNIITLNGLKANTTYNITVRAYQQLLGPVSNAITVHTSSG